MSDDLTELFKQVNEEAGATPEPEPEVKAEDAKTVEEEQPKDVEAEAEPKPQEATQEESETETGESEEEGSPPSEEDKDLKGKESTILAERRRRQEAQEQARQAAEREQLREAENQQLRQMLFNLQGQPEPEAAPNPLEDSDAYAKYLDRRFDEFERTQANRFIDQSVANARLLHKDDYDDVMSVYKQIVDENPKVHEDAQGAANPGEYAYQVCKHYINVSEVGTDPEAWKQAEREKIRAELQAQTPAANPSIPETLASEPSASNKTSTKWAGPPPDEEVFKKKF